MHRYWDSVVEPVLGAVGAQVVVEVGVERGLLTERLLAWSEGHDATIHAVDPAPDIEREGLIDHPRLVLHRARSLNVLGHLDRIDAALLDGDHNWYTVHRELMLLERRAREAQDPMPVVLLHDLDWPYGRRDLYYDPESIPVAYRLPHERKGILPGSGELAEGGLNGHLQNAIYEHGVADGVLTAVEDFVAESSRDWVLHRVHGFHGIGVLVDGETIAASSSLREVLEQLRSPAFLEAHGARLEEARIDAEIRAANERRSRAAAGDEIARLRQHRDTADAERRRAEERQSQAEAALAASRAQLDTLRAEIDDASTRRAEVERELGDVRRHAGRAQRERHAALMRVSTLEEQLAEGQRETERREAEHARMRQLAETRRRDLDGVRTELAQAQDRLRQAAGEADTLGQALEARGRQLLALAACAGVAERGRAAAERQATEGEERIASLEGELSGLRRQSADLCEQLAERDAALESLARERDRDRDRLRSLEHARSEGPGAMRIGFVEPHIGAVGGIRRILETSNRLVERGHEVRVYLPSDQLLRCDWMPCAAELRHLDDAADDELDFVVFNHEPQWYLLDRFEHARYRVFLALSYSRAYEKSGSWEALRLPVDLRLANSAWTADRIAAEVGRRPAVVSTGIDRQLFRPGDATKRYPVLCVGDKRPWKGTEVVERACAQLGIVPEKLAGKGLSQEALADEYRKAEIFVVGSPVDGFGFPGLEALASGVPLVTTDNGGCREYAVDGETALVVPPDDPDAMARAIARLRSDPDLRARLVRNGLEMAKRFSWDRAADDFERELTTLLDERPEPVGPRPRALREREPKPVVTIVVLSYNTLELLMRCVESVRQTTDVPYELVIVDNASEDGSAEYVAAAADHPIVNADNAGFSGGFNQGLAAARGRFVFFLNSDTKLPPNWASRLVETAERRPDAGIVFPAVTTAGNALTVRTQPSDRITLLPPYLEPPSGVALLMRTELARALGGWNELYEVASGEDTDLCFTVWVNGLATVLDEAVLVDHVAKASASQLPDQRLRWARNRQRFLQRWTGPLDDLPRIDAIDAEAFEANKRVARGVAFWMSRYFHQRDRDLLGAEALAPAALVAAAQLGDVDPSSATAAWQQAADASPNGRPDRNGAGDPRLVHLPVRAAWRAIRPLVPAAARERYYRRHRTRYERVFPDRVPTGSSIDDGGGSR